MSDDDRLVTVCSACKQASCWQALFYCDKYLTAGTVDLPVRRLKELGLENPCYWSIPHLRKMGIET